LQGPEAARQSAWAGAWHSFLLQSEGRTNEALAAAEQAATEAEAANDPEAAGEAYFVMGWVSGDLRNGEAVPLMQRSLEAFERSGNVVRQADLLSNLGVMCHWEGRWDEALTFFERGRQASLKIGSTDTAALARLNSAEILIDRGEWAEAETALLQTMPLWRRQYRLYLAFCLLLLGRVSRTSDSSKRLDSTARRIPRTSQPMTQSPRSTPASPNAARRHGESRSRPRARGGHARARQHVNGIARSCLCRTHQRSRTDAAGDECEGRWKRSLAEQDRRDLFEAALTSLSLIELDRGRRPPLGMVNRADCS
jgi:tetratricopeptide (TPR) repeat protein